VNWGWGMGEWRNVKEVACKMLTRSRRNYRKRWSTRQEHASQSLMRWQQQSAQSLTLKNVSTDFEFSRFHPMDSFPADCLKFRPYPVRTCQYRQASLRLQNKNI
jgi:hypothetical protein